MTDTEVAGRYVDVSSPPRRVLPLGSPDRRRSSVDERFYAPDSPLLVEGAALEKVATGAVWAEGPVWVPRRRAVRFRDRKSTRLNSSHVAISYAVFCLKKKIKNYYIHYYQYQKE